MRGICLTALGILACTLLATGPALAAQPPTTYLPDPLVVAWPQWWDDTTAEWKDLPFTGCVNQSVRVMAVDSPGHAAPLIDIDTAQGDGQVEDVAIAYAWTWGDGTPSSSGLGQQHRWTAPGTYTVTLAADDPNWIRADDPTAMKGIGGNYVIGGPIHADDPCGKKLVLAGDSQYEVTDQFAAHPNQPSGTTYDWMVDQGADKAEVVEPKTNATCKIRAKAASTAENDVRIRLTYTNRGVSCYAYLTTTVQKPTHLVREDLGYTVRTCVPSPWVERQFRDTVYDQFNQPVANAWWGETWNPPIGSQNSLYTLCDGHIIDVWSNTQAEICSDPVGEALYSGTQTVNVSDWGCFLRYHRDDRRGWPGTIDYANLGCP